MPEDVAEPIEAPGVVDGVLGTVPGEALGSAARSAESVRPLSAEAATFCDPPPYGFDPLKRTAPRQASDPIWAILGDSAKWPLGFEDALFVARSAIENLYAAGFVVAPRPQQFDGSGEGG